MDSLGIQVSRMNMMELIKYAYKASNGPIIGEQFVFDIAQEKQALANVLYIMPTRFYHHLILCQILVYSRRGEARPNSSLGSLYGKILLAGLGLCCYSRITWRIWPNA